LKNGFIKIHRQLSESEIFQKPAIYLKVFMYLIMKANFQDTTEFKRGQNFFSIPELIEVCSYKKGYTTVKPTKRQIQNVIDFLRKPSEGSMIVTTKVTQGSLYFIVNYDKFQDFENANVTTNGQRRLHERANSNKNDLKNDKNKNTISFSENEKEDTDNSIKQIIDYLNLRNNSNYRYNSKKTVSLIKARLKEGFIVDDFKTVIDNKVEEWENDNKMSKFLRPVTLFGEKFESYLNEKKFSYKKPENNDDKFYLIEQIIAEGKYRSESQLHLLPELEAEFVRSLPCGFNTINELSGNEFEYNKLKKQYKNFIKEKM